ncbi:MAG: TetR/AcrR family transcriptional regulator [Gammaproteobacteria bacterium]|jgi:AcrR family transcriptional regulator|nr:TetR/AcrR family transcriptional regulator [Gammaproteobacteria bacterium]
MSGSDANRYGKSYHHGDLRNALIIAAGELIEEQGSLDFSMAEAARRANVSSAAPYRHFADRNALLQAVAEVAFMALDEEIRQTVALLAPGSREHLIAQGKTYIAFVIRHRAFYDLMWGDIGLRRKSTADMELQTSDFYILVDSVKAWCAASGLENDNPLELAVKFWAMGHGLACLAMNGNIEHVMPGADIYSLFESSANTFLEGLERGR